MLEPNQKLSAEFLDCLKVERKEDYEQTEQLLASTPPKILGANGLAILNLVITNIRTGIGGKMILELSTPNFSTTKSKKKTDSEKENLSIEIGEFRIGDIVKIDKYTSVNTRIKTQKKLKNSSKIQDQNEFEDDATLIQGVVTSIARKQINVAISYDQISKEGSKIQDKIYMFYDNATHLWVVQLSNEITYNRMESTLRKLSELNAQSCSTIIKFLIGTSKFIPPSLSSIAADLKFVNNGLNESQKRGIRFSLASNFSVIHGPPGTGKTSTLIEFVKQHLIEYPNKRILITGPSNISIDTIIERLSPFFSKTSELIRIGHPARLLPSTLKHSLDILVESEFRDVLNDILRDISKQEKLLKKAKSYGARRDIYSEIKLLKKELRIRSKKSIAETLIQSKVIVATLHGSSSRDLVSNIPKDEPFFSTLIIDEVSQALEPSCWIPIIYHPISKLIIAGDNKQLSPTVHVKKNDKLKNILERSLFDRLVQLHNNNRQFICFLDTQYRMNEKIMRFPSDEWYNSRLNAWAGVKDGKVIDLLKHVVKEDDNDDATEEIIWYDTQGGEFPEREEDGGFIGSGVSGSKYNEGECYVVKKYVEKLVHMGVKEEDIGIIAPYSAQVSKLRKLLRSGTLEEDGDNFNRSKELFEKVEISTVDGFQGREKEIIIFSLVRSNEAREVGFLSDFRRLNVSITRCKKQLCIIGDMETVSESKVNFLKDWCNWCEDNVDIRYVNNNEIY